MVPIDINAVTVCINFSHYFKHCISNKKYFMNFILKNHPNQSAFYSPTTSKSTINKNDQLGGYCHLSNRGNLLLAIEINKHLFSNDESI